jgi:adenylate cyclase
MLRRIVSSKWFQFFILMGILFGFAYFATSNYRANQTLRNYAFDTFNRMDQRPTSNDIIIADIDEKSLEKIGQWPWPRDVIAEMVLNLKEMGARAVAFDMVFAEPDRMSPKRFAHGLVDKGLIDDEMKSKLAKLPDNDEILAQAFKQAGNVVTGFTYAKPEDTRNMPYLPKRVLTKIKDKIDLAPNLVNRHGVSTNLELFAKSIAGNGSFMTQPGADGKIRKYNAILSITHSDYKPDIYPSLGIEGLRVFHNRKDSVKIGQIKTDSNTLKSRLNSSREKNYTIRIGTSNMDVPIKKDGSVYLKFRELDRDKDYVSISDVIGNTKDIKDKINGKLVLIGTSAEGLGDIRNTAIKAFVPGVEVHFNFVEQVIQNIYLFRDGRISMLIELFVILIFGGIIVIASLYFGAIILTLLVSVFIFIIFCSTFYLYKFENLLFDPINSSLAIFSIFVVAALVNYLRSELSKREIRDAFGLYISPDFMEELTDNPDKLSLGGEIRDLTVMFSDIRNFTTISESMTPEELILTMNDFLTPMSDVVMERRGTIDKYMGDAMMAFWNAPLDDDNHAKNAVLAALDMKAALEPVNQMLADRAAKTGSEPLRLAAGIGINSGPCAVGNMGSKQRFAYSALGDAVNLASRLEGQTKSYGLDLLVGEETINAIRDFAIIDIDLIQVKGKTKPVQIFTVLGDVKTAAGDSFQSFIKNHNQFIQFYREGDFDAALENIQLCLDCGHSYSYDLKAYYGVMMNRIHDMNKKTPPDWDGVFVATSK